MQEKNNINISRSLKGYLIKWFLIIVGIIYVLQEIIGVLYRNFLIPVLIDWFEKQNIMVGVQDNMSLLLINLFLLQLASFLPNTIAFVVRNFLRNNLGALVQLNVESANYGGSYATFLRICILLLLIALLVIWFLPYFLGAVAYYQLVNVKVNELIAEENRKKREYDKNRNLLLSDIAHDIKTPITTICGYSKALTDGMVNEERKRDYLEAIYNKSMRMSELITMLFEYVKIDSTGYEMKMESGDLAEVLRECVAVVYEEFEEKDMEVIMEIPEEARYIRMDRLQLGRAISNLISNAVRYGKQGGKVFIGLQEYTLTVADDGMVIDEEFAGHIFEPFTRADRARSTKGGSGLGLSISHKIVEMHGGRLLLDTNYGKGYTKAFVMKLDGAKEETA